MSENSKPESREPRPHGDEPVEYGSPTKILLWFLIPLALVLAYGVVTALR